MNPSALPAVCLGDWRSEDGTRHMRISDPGDGPRVTVWSCSEAKIVHLDDRPAKWHPPEPTAAASPNARQRLGYLQVEVGDPGLGSTYDLMAATGSTEPTAFGGFHWRPLAPETSRSDVRLFPEGGASYFEAVLGYYDDAVEAMREADAWMQPLSTWQPA